MTTNGKCPNCKVNIEQFAKAVVKEYGSTLVALGQDDELNALVRDACSVVPVPKSEYRKRLLEWRHRYALSVLEGLKTVKERDGFDQYNPDDWLSEIDAAISAQQQAMKGEKQ